MDTIKQIQTWFKAAVPAPTDASRCVQIGCHFEEAAEMQEALGMSTDNLAGDALAWKTVKGRSAACWANNVDRAALLDSLADQIVTAIGVAHMYGFDIQGALAEVNRSNYSKFNEDGRPDFDANGKIVKGPNYSPPDLAPFVGSSGK